ncbi:hypothetical protein EG028_01075 [Chitinophaga barathri]|uniref:Uncharacterized protein n=2 Tax=Chitinophaga barathri TaxID=1647451 RepID=A0A3N4MS13_9BACT|nr:hypothetical protein EG028_01075 [Chitinophaga barathri]
MAALPVMLIVSAPRAQDPRKVNDSLSNSLQEMNTALLAAHRTWADLADKEAAYAPVIKQVDRIDQLITKISDWNYSDAKFNVVNSLRYKQKLYQELDNYAALMNASFAFKQPDSIIAVLGYIEDDISGKMTGAGAASPVTPALVNVKVSVEEEGAPGVQIPGIKVFIKPEMVLAPRYTEELSTGATPLKRLMPGRKIIWIEQDGKVLAEKKTIVHAGVDTDTIAVYIGKKQH